MGCGSEVSESVGLRRTARLWRLRRLFLGERCGISPPILLAARTRHGDGLWQRGLRIGGLTPHRSPLAAPPPFSWRAVWHKPTYSLGCSNPTRRWVVAARSQNRWAYAAPLAFGGSAAFFLASGVA